MKLGLNDSYIATNPACASGLRNYACFTSDFGDAIFRVALFHKGPTGDGSWEVLGPVNVYGSLGDYSILLADDVRKVSVKVTAINQVGGEPVVVGFDLLSTQTKVGS